MSRSYSEVGLKQEARVFLSENVKKRPVEVCPTCKHQTGGEWEQKIYNEEPDVWYGEGRVFREYELKDGRVAKEVLQEEPWSSGPVAFFCLEIDGKRVFEWTDEEIQEYL